MTVPLMLLPEVLGVLLHPVHDPAAQQEHRWLRYADEITLSLALAGGGPPHDQALPLLGLGLVERVAGLEHCLGRVEALLGKLCWPGWSSLVDSLTRLVTFMDRKLDLTLPGNHPSQADLPESAKEGKVPLVFVLADLEADQPR